MAKARDRGNPYEFFVDVEPGPPEVAILRVRVNEPPDPYWSAILGDSIQNCRSILDHIYTALVDAAGGDSGRAYFPIYKTEGEFNKNAVPSFNKHGLKDTERAIIKSLQPFEGRVRPITHHPGWVIRELANLDKHRSLITQNLTQRELKLIVAFPELGMPPIEIPPNPEPIVLEDGAEVGRFSFFTDDPLLLSTDTHVQVKGNLGAQLHAEGIPMEGVATWPILWIEHDVIPRFEPILSKL